ncbi:hypothetical protein NARC_90100 [Candidatus Nitrosocosmicus arcticus]|uniref:Uncharacterized protein n=1 Tax=Candidatus Nitrosocosmicus arcticus TaxID=2035267 RepID=A0A557SUA9_9ARCH|nr:hypothetical protein NARC_90100 [Candidatus Nitrosocosmicus arcticus]
MARNYMNIRIIDFVSWIIVNLAGALKKSNNDSTVFLIKVYNGSIC